MNVRRDESRAKSKDLEGKIREARRRLKEIKKARRTLQRHNMKTRSEYENPSAAMVRDNNLPASEVVVVSGTHRQSRAAMEMFPPLNPPVISNTTRLRTVSCIRLVGVPKTNSTGGSGKG